jgi:hypothetical protein
MTSKEIVAYYKRRPITGEIFLDVMGRVIGQLRVETKKQIQTAVDAVRGEVGLLPISKPADLMALTNEHYRALNERPKVRVAAGRGRTW